MNEESKKKERKIIFKFMKNHEVLVVYPEDQGGTDELARLTASSKDQINHQVLAEPKDNTLNLDEDSFLKKINPDKGDLRNHFSLSELSSILENEPEDTRAVGNQRQGAQSVTESKIKRLIHPDATKKSLLDLYDIKNNQHMLPVITEENIKTQRT